MMNKYVLPLIVIGSVACVPNNPILKNTSISVTAGSATYSLNEYCMLFDQEDRKLLRQHVNAMSSHKAVITCSGDTE